MSTRSTRRLNLPSIQTLLERANNSQKFSYTTKAMRSEIPGVFLFIGSGDYHATIRLENSIKDFQRGFRETRSKPSRITYFHVAVNTVNLPRYFKGKWDLESYSPETGKHQPQRQDYSKAEKEDPKFARFLRDVLEIFS